MTILTWSIVALLLIFAWRTHTRRSASQRQRLPPGPKPLPLLGNAHQLPMEYQEYTFKQWGKTYGGPLLRYFVLKLTSLRQSDLCRILRQADPCCQLYEDRPRAPGKEGRYLLQSPAACHSGRAVSHFLQALCLSSLKTGDACSGQGGTPRCHSCPITTRAGCDSVDGSKVRSGKRLLSDNTRLCGREKSPPFCTA